VANRGEPLEGGRGATAPSIIREIQEEQRREETPPDGGVVTPKDVHVQPFSSKSKLNSSLNVRIFVKAGGSNGFPSGHADFDNGHPCLLEHPFERVAIAEVPSAPLGLEIVQGESVQDVKWLSSVGEAADVISVEPGGGVLVFSGGLAE
jgi:hypothetical protein